MMQKAEVPRKTYLKSFQKFLRIFIFSLLFGGLVIAGYHCVNQFIDKPTYTATKIQQQHDGEFPALSICPYFSGYKEKILKKHGIPDKNCYNSPPKCKGSKPNWIGNDSSISPRELFNKSILNVEEVFNEILVRFFYAHDKFGPDNALTEDDLKRELKRSPHRYYGHCFTYYPEESYRMAGIYYIRISLKVPARIHIHEKNQFLAFNGRLGHSVMIGEKNFVSLNIHEVNQIRRISQHDHSDLPDTIFEHEYSCDDTPYDKCIWDRISREMIARTEDNCTVPWFPPHELSNGKICSKEKDINISYDLYLKRITNARKDCNEPCRVLILNQSGKNYGGKNETWDHGIIYFYFSTSSFKSSEEFLYPIEVLIAEFGGFMGLLLGLSILDIAFKIVDIIG